MITEDNSYRHSYVNGVAPRHRPMDTALGYVATAQSLLDTTFGDERGIIKMTTMMRNQGMDP